MILQCVDFLFYAFLLFLKGGVCLAVVCQDFALQVDGLVYLAVILVESEIIVGRNLGCVVVLGLKRFDL